MPDLIEHTVKHIQSNLADGQKALYIADSALYTQANVQTMGNKTLFITRAPATIGWVQTLEKAALDFTPSSLEGYAMYRSHTDYGGVPQTVVVVESQAMKKDQLRRFERKQERLEESARKELRKLSRQQFFCAQDAQNELERFQSQHPLFQVTLDQIQEKKVRTDGKRGKPTDHTPMTKTFQIKATLDFDQEAIAHKTAHMGRFVLVTNDMSLDDETILTYYKEQSQVEKGFRFVKDPVFCVDNVFLKSPERIMALSMIMVLTLLVYNLLDHDLVRKAKEKKAVIRGPENRILKRPTMRAIFIIFQGVNKQYQIINGEKHECEMDGMEDRLWDILELLGDAYVEMYV